MNSPDMTRTKENEKREQVWSRAERIIGVVARPRCKTSQSFDPYGKIGAQASSVIPQINSIVNGNTKLRENAGAASLKYK